MKIKYQIPGVTRLTLEPLFISTDGGPWAHHNIPCPVCKENTAILNLAGWVAEPCIECGKKGWRLEQKRPSLWRRWLGLA